MALFYLVYRNPCYNSNEEKKIREDTLTEKEKMINELYYDSSDENLVQDRLKAKDICFKLNQTLPSDKKKRDGILEDFLGKTSENFEIISPFWCDYGYNIEIGNNFFANHNTVILDCAKVIFGDNVFIGPNCSFLTVNHPMDVNKRNAGIEIAKPIIIEENVWIGGNVTIMPGVRIGKNSVIGAGSLVVKDIGENNLAFGSPCKVIRKI